MELFIQITLSNLPWLYANRSILSLWVMPQRWRLWGEYMVSGSLLCPQACYEEVIKLSRSPSGSLWSAPRWAGATQSDLLGFADDPLVRWVPAWYAGLQLGKTDSGDRHNDILSIKEFREDSKNVTHNANAFTTLVNTKTFLPRHEAKLPRCTTFWGLINVFQKTTNHLRFKSSFRCRIKEREKSNHKARPELIINLCKYSKVSQCVNSVTQHYNFATHVWFQNKHCSHIRHDTINYTWQEDLPSDILLNYTKY